MKSSLILFSTLIFLNYTYGNKPQIRKNSPKKPQIIAKKNIKKKSMSKFKPNKKGSLKKGSLVMTYDTNLLKADENPLDQKIKEAKELLSKMQVEQANDVELFKSLQREQEKDRQALVELERSYKENQDLMLKKISEQAEGLKREEMLKAERKKLEDAIGDLNRVIESNIKDVRRLEAIESDVNLKKEMFQKKLDGIRNLDDLAEKTAKLLAQKKNFKTK